jgi:hypothetical protein
MQRDQERYDARLQGSTDSHGASATTDSPLLRDNTKYQRKYYSKNKEKVKDRVRRWRAKNRKKYNEYMRNLRKKKA